MALTKGFTQNGGPTPLDTRLMDAEKVCRNADGSPRTGVLWTGTSTGNVVGALGSMAVVVRSADFVLSRSQNDGVVFSSNVGDVNVTIAAAPSANSRIDAIWVKQNDNTLGDADSLPTFGTTLGVAAASPQASATLANVPTGALVLATILLPANVTTTNASGVVITNTFLYTAMAGDPIRYRNEVDMRADITLLDGASAYISGGGLFYRRAGTWTRLDASTFAVNQTQTDQTLATGTALATIGGQSPRYDSSDVKLLPNAAPVIGPLPIAGWYRLTANVNWTGNATGLRHIEFTDNDTVFNPPAADERPGTATSGAGNNQSLSSTLYFNAGDYIKLKAWQNSGATLSYRSRFIVELVRGD